MLLKLISTYDFSLDDIYENYKANCKGKSGEYSLG